MSSGSAANTIDFLIVEEHASAPRPTSAHSKLPEWFKAEPNWIEVPGGEGSDETKVATYKRCLPFVDLMRTGYILPLWDDLAFSVEPCACGSPACSEPPEIRIEWSTSGVAPRVERRMWNSWGSIPGLESGVQGSSFAFVNPWIVRTPPGYSTLFTTPFNNSALPHPELQLFSGLVNTDTYFNQITLFFYVSKPFEGVIEKGTPLAQMIPIKRSAWEHRIVQMGPGDDNKAAHNAEREYLYQTPFDAYRNRHGCPIRHT